MDTLIAHALDSHSAALHEEILITADAVFLGRGDVERQVLDADIVAALDGVLGASYLTRPISCKKACSGPTPG